MSIKQINLLIKYHKTFLQLPDIQCVPRNGFGSKKSADSDVTIYTMYPSVHKLAVP